MTDNQVVSTMFDFNMCNHMVRFILSGNEIEDPISNIFIQVVFEYIQCTVAYIHIVCLVAMFKFESLTHRIQV